MVFRQSLALAAGRFRLVVAGRNRPIADVHHRRSRQHQSLFLSFKKKVAESQQHISSMSRQPVRELGDAELQPVFRLISHVSLEMIEVLRNRWMQKYGPATF